MISVNFLNFLKINGRLFWLGAFFVFFAGFFIFHGREAANSGSWRYILSHDDEYGYWTTSKGASETPVSDANPFFYEEQGSTNSFPYTTAQLIGLLAGLLHLPVMFFFPIWHIGMPFLLWAALFLAMKKIWHYPPGFSAAFALLLLLSTLFLRGQAPFILFRYSRPGDGLWLLILSLSFIFNLENNRKRYVLFAAVSGAVVLWLQAYYAFLPLLAAAGEGAWQFFIHKKKRAAIDFGLIILSILLSGLLYFFYVKAHPSPWWITHMLAGDRLHEKLSLHWPSLILYGSLLSFIVSTKIYLRGSLTKWDRLVIFVLLIEPLTTHLRLVLDSDWQLSIHRYYFLVIELAVLTGWLAEKIPLLLKTNFIKHGEPLLVLFCIAIPVFLSLNPNTCFFLYSTPEPDRYKLFDNSLLLIELFPVLCLLVWSNNRFKKVSSWTRRPSFIIPLITLITLAGYFFLPSQTGKNNRDFPFDAAYRWFEKNAHPKEVVLTAMPSRLRDEDYLILYTDLKTYYHPYWGYTYSKDREAFAYREMFCAALLLGNLDKVPIKKALTMDQKLTTLRLDYILINRPSPFTERIQRQLGGHIREVYRDDRSLIWRVTAKKS